MSQRLPLNLGAGQVGGRLTRFYVPVAALQRLSEQTGQRGRSHWVAGALQQLEALDPERRDFMLLHDNSVRMADMKSLPVRLNQDSHTRIRRIIKNFRQTYPSQDLDASGVLRTAILMRLRQETGLLVLSQD